MDVKEAVATAKTYLSNVFAGESVSEIRLEEVEYDGVDGAWLITLGLLRPSGSEGQGQFARITTPVALKRTYKIVRVPDGGSDKPSIKIRELSGE